MSADYYDDILETVRFLRKLVSIQTVQNFRNFYCDFPIMEFTIPQ